MQRLIPALALVLFASSAAAQNAPFCAVSAAGRDCFYYDLPSCQERASAMRGACVVNNSSGAQSPQQDTWGAFQRGARIGEMGSREPPATPQAASNLGPVIEQFCRELQQQDLAELDAIPVGTEQANQEYARRIDMYQARSQRCFAMARAAR